MKWEENLLRIYILYCSQMLRYKAKERGTSFIDNEDPVRKYIYLIVFNKINVF